MEKGLRTALWVLSSLAVLWTALAVIGLVGMGAMMHGGMMGTWEPGGTTDGMMGGSMMISMMLHMGLTWIVMHGGIASWRAWVMVCSSWASLRLAGFSCVGARGSCIQGPRGMR
jgi:hypothetical protein